MNRSKIKKISKTIFWISMVLLFITIMGFAQVNQQKNTLQEINIFIDFNHAFVSKKEIEKILNKKQIVLGRLLHEINTFEIEQILSENPYAKNVEVYKSLNGKLYINIIQRTPIARIFTSEYESFYVDDEGMLMPATSLYTPRVLVCSGHVFNKVNDNRALIKILNDPKQQDSKNILLGLFNLVKYIHADKFWNKQITMVYVNKNNEFELMPLLGSHSIVFGSAEQMEEKFNKLYVLYSEGLSRTGWNIYEKIDLRYKNQVICKQKNNHEYK